MRRLAVSILAAGFAAVVLPHAVAAQCEGGPTVTGTFSRDGSYVPAHCQYTNPTTPGQLYPSGAQPMPSTNPAQGASRLPGQVAPSGLLPVNSSDLGAAPSFVNTNGLQGSDVATLAPGQGPGAPVTRDVTNIFPGGTAGTAGNSLLPGQSMTSSTTAATTTAGMDSTAVTNIAGVNAAGATTGLPDQFPQTGLPALNGNRAVPSNLSGVNGVGTAGQFNTTGSLNGFTNAVAGAVNAPGSLTSPTGAVPGAVNPTSRTNVGQVNAGDGVSSSAAPARRETLYTSEQLSTNTVVYPGQ